MGDNHLQIGPSETEQMRLEHVVATDQLTDRFSLSGIASPRATDM